jgi:hypothetical protein
MCDGTDYNYYSNILVYMKLRVEDCRYKAVFREIIGYEIVLSKNGKIVFQERGICDRKLRKARYDFLKAVL